MDIFKLYRTFWDFAFANPDKIKPVHIAVFSFSIEHCNRLGWKEKFGFPSAMAMEATGIKSYNTYIATFMDLVDFGFFKLIEKSKNQYSSNIIALSTAISKNNKALDKALIKHTTKHTTKQGESTVQSIDSIIKQEDNQYTINQSTEESTIENQNEIFKTKLLSEKFKHEREAIEISCKVRITEEMLRDFNANLINQGKEHNHWSEYKKHLIYWIPKKPHEKPPQKQNTADKQPISKTEKAIATNAAAREIIIKKYQTEIENGKSVSHFAEA